MMTWVGRISGALAIIAAIGWAFMQGMATEAARFSRFVEASTAVYMLVRDTPQGKELKAAYDELMIAGKLKKVLLAPALAPSAATDATVGISGAASCPTPVDIDTLLDMIRAGKKDTK